MATNPQLNLLMEVSEMWLTALEKAVSWPWLWLFYRTTGHKVKNKRSRIGFAFLVMIKARFTQITKIHVFSLTLMVFGQTDINTSTLKVIVPIWINLIPSVSTCLVRYFVMFLVLPLFPEIILYIYYFMPQVFSNFDLELNCKSIKYATLDYSTP